MREHTVRNAAAQQKESPGAGARAPFLYRLNKCMTSCFHNIRERRAQQSGALATLRYAPILAPLPARTRRFAAEQMFGCTYLLSCRPLCSAPLSPQHRAHGRQHRKVCNKHATRHRPYLSAAPHHCSKLRCTSTSLGAFCGASVRTLNSTLKL